MNYKQMLEKFRDLEQRLKSMENTVLALQHRINTLERPNFSPTWPQPQMPQVDPQWPREFWPTLYPVTCNTKDKE